MQQRFHCELEKRIGEGTFGQVFEGLQKGTEAPLAIKTFKDDHANTFAMHEVCAFSAFEPHPHLLMLVDVGCVNGRMCLATQRYEKNLCDLLKIRALEQVELKHILRCMCDGMAHLHGAGVGHFDLKPANVLLQLGRAPPADKGPNAEFARWLFQLPDLMAVCVADFGNALLADSRQRSILSEKHVTNFGVDEVTLWYRAPEILLGLVKHKTASEMWSLG